MVRLWDGPWPGWRLWVDEPLPSWIVVEYHDGARLKHPTAFSQTEDPTLYRYRGNVRLTTRRRQGKVAT